MPDRVQERGEEGILRGHLRLNPTHFVDGQLWVFCLEVGDNEIDSAALAYARTTVNKRTTDEHEKTFVNQRDHGLDRRRRQPT